MSDNILDALKKLVSRTGVPSRARNIVEAIDEYADYTDNPLVVLTVDTEIGADDDLYGKVVSDLQEDDIVIGDRDITGTLNYVSDYTDFSGNEEEQSGNYLAIHVSTPDVNDTTLSVKVSQWDATDADGYYVIRVVKGYTDKILVKASKEGYPDVIREFDLTGLTLTPEPANP